MQLYAIDDRIYQVIEHDFDVDAETGEIYDDLAALEIERKDKIEAVAMYVKNCEAEADAIREEEKRLAERRRVLENKAERMRQYIASSMALFGDAKIETPRVALSFRKSKSVEITDESQIPEAFMRVKREPDKSGIRNMLTMGYDVPGARMVERHTLQVK